MFRATVLTLFPEMFPGPLGLSLAGDALSRGVWTLEPRQIREHGLGRHRAVDDTPAGGGPGMVMRADVLAAAIDAAAPKDDPRPRLLMSPRGAPLTQARARASPKAPARSFFAPGSKASTSASSTPAGSKKCRSAISCFRAARSRRWR